MSNCVVDIYRNFNAAAPYKVGPAAVAAQPATIRHHLKNGIFGFATPLHWTTLLFLPIGTDIRSAFNTHLPGNAPNWSKADTVIIQNYPLPGWQTAFVVVLIQKPNRSQPSDYLRCYLDRLQPIRTAASADPVKTSCCAEVLPNRLLVTFDTSNIQQPCACADKATFPIFWDGLNNQWTGTGTVCGQPSRINLACPPGGASAQDFIMSGTFCNAPLNDPGVKTVQCPPSFQFLQFWGLFTQCCTGATKIIVTA